MSLGGTDKIIGGVCAVVVGGDWDKLEAFLVICGDY